MLASDKISLEELFALDDSDTSANTTQAATAENSNMAASIQSDAIPPEVSGCEKDGTWQKILVEATGSNATLTLWTYRDGQWEKDLSTTAAIGANGLTTDKTEGDHMTPEGTFPICFAFSTKEKNTMLYSKIIKEDSVWVCDPESIYYNTLQSKNDPYKDWADKGGAENMYPKFSKGSSNACNGVQREHNKKLNNGLPILHKVPPKRDYGRYFCIMAEKGGTSHGGLTEKLSPFFHAKKQEVNAYGR